MPATRGKKETVSYANVMARLNDKMSLMQQVDIMINEFKYSRMGAYEYLKRNNIKNSGRETKLRIDEVEKYVNANMSKKEKIITIMKQFDASYSTTRRFLASYPDCGRKAKPEKKNYTPIELVCESVKVVEEKQEVKTVDNLAEIKKTIAEIETLEAQLKEKKEWLKMMMEEYVKC